MGESRRTKMTKRLLKDSLLEQLRDKPIGKVSVTAICAGADVNRSTFYAYYEDVTALLEEIENDVFEHMPQINDMSGIQQNKEFLHLNIRFFDYIRDNVTAFRVLLLDSQSSSFHDRMLKKLYEMYLNNIAQGGNDELHTRLRYVYIANGALGMLKEWIELDFPVGSREFANLIMDIASY